MPPCIATSWPAVLILFLDGFTAGYRLVAPVELISTFLLVHTSNPENAQQGLRIPIPGKPMKNERPDETASCRKAPSRK